MISVEWLNNKTCGNCRQNRPNCAQITLPIEDEDVSDEFNDRNSLLCSDCVEDLKKKLS